MKNKAGDMMKVGYEVVCDGNTKVYNMPGLFWMRQTEPYMR